MDDEDDPARQAEVARRLFAKAAALRESNDNDAAEPGPSDADLSETDPESETSAAERG